MLNYGMSDDYIPKGLLNKVDRSDAGRMGDPASKDVRYSKFSELLNAWQVSLNLKESQSLFAYSGLDGVLTEDQWAAFKEDTALPDQLLGSYFQKVISKTIDLNPRNFSALLRKSPHLQRIEIAPIEHGLLAKLPNIYQQAQVSQPDSGIRWPYPFAERTLEETVGSPFFKKMMEHLKERYDPNHIKTDQELLTALGGIIDTNASRHHGRVKITPLMLMGFVRIPETLSIDNFCLKLARFFDTDNGNIADEAFFNEMKEFYEAAKGIDLVTPHKAGLGEKWEYFHAIRINERAGTTNLTLTKKTINYESLRQAETKGLSLKKNLHPKALAGVLNSYPSLTQNNPNRNVLREKMGGIKQEDQESLRGYVKHLIQQRGVSYNSIARISQADFPNSSFPQSINVNRLLSKNSDRTISAHHLDVILSIISKDDAAIIESNKGKTIHNIDPTGVAPTKAQITKAYQLFEKEKQATGKPHESARWINKAIKRAQDSQNPPPVER